MARSQRGRVRRTLRPAALAGRAAARWAHASLARGEKRTRRREQAMLRTAEDVTRTMGEMKGAVMKLGQVLSLMGGVVPDELATQLTSLQSQAPPMAYELVTQVVQEELGAPPERAFRSFNRSPFAAASIGQVHRAVLHGGERVAVKVQYPGVAGAIEHDLANVGVLLGFAGMFSSLDTGALIRDLTDGITAELDYLQEAAWQQRFFDLYEGHGFVRVPRVYHELTRSRVLVQEYLDGKPFAAAKQLPNPERQRVAESIFRFAFGNFYRYGLFNGDPHPGNYLLLPHGKVGFVDYGCVATFSQEVIDRFRKLVIALFDGDLERWRAAAEDVGILRREAPFTTEELYEHMHWFWEPVLSERVAMTQELVAEMVRRNSMATGQGGRINRHLNIPEGMAFLTRINFGLSGVLASIDAEGPWRAIVGEYVYGGPPSTPLGELSAATTRHGLPV